MGRLGVVLALASVLAAVPGVAAASTVGVDPATGDAVFAGGGGANDVTMDVSRRVPGSPFQGPALSFTDAAQGLTAGAGCAAGLPVWCEALDAVVGLDGVNDRYDGYSDGDLTVSGGVGDDRITASGMWTSVSGGGGADWISVGSNGYEAAYGGGGDDDIRSDTDGSQAVLRGGAGDDLLYAERKLDDVAGGAGDDAVILGGRLSSVQAAGGGGDDVMLVAATPAGGTVTLRAGDGADVIAGGLTTDTVYGDGGNDVIDVSGDAGQAGPDTVDCGSGNDTVYADAEDVVAGDCESRRQGPMPSTRRVRAALARLADAFGVTVTT